MRYKYEINHFLPYEFAAIEHHLERRIHEGWMLDGMSCGAFRYRRCEPSDISFKILYLPGDLEDEPELFEKMTNLINNMQFRGWEPLIELEQMVIYSKKREKKDPEFDIEPQIMIDLLRESMNRQFMVINVVFATLFLIYIAYEGIPFKGAAEPALVLGRIMLFAIPVSLVLKMIMYGIWMRMSDKRISEGKNFCNTAVAHWVSVMTCALIISGLLILLILLLSDISVVDDAIRRE